MPEDFSHRLQAGEWDIDEGARLVKATFKHDRVEMRVPPEHIAERLVRPTIPEASGTCDARKP